MESNFLNFNIDEKTSILFIVLLVFSLVLTFFAGRLFQKLRNLSLVKKEREDAVKRSRAVLGGQFGEMMAPLVKDFPCNPGDVRFIGKPLDYVAFSGMAEGKEIKEILFIEVKTGKSGLSKREEEVKKAVEEGRVRWVEYRMN